MKRPTEIFDIIGREHLRQRHGIELIASENFVSDSYARNKFMPHQQVCRRISLRTAIMAAAGW